MYRTYTGNIIGKSINTGTAQRTNEITEYMMNKDWAYDDPEFRKKINISAEDYRQVLEEAKNYYTGTENPDSYVTRQALGQVISDILGVDQKTAAEHAEDFMYQATGYHTNVDSLGEQLVNTFRSAGSSYLASMKIAGLYLTGAFQDNESFNLRKEEAMEELKRYAKTYRSDLYMNDKGLFTDVMTQAANILPSMLPTIGITGVTALISTLTGGTALPFVGGTIGLLKTASSLSKAEKVLALTSKGAQFASSFMMEMGGSAMEMMEMGFDKDVILPVSVGVGTINGLFEMAGDLAESNAVKPIAKFLDSLGGKTKREIIDSALKKTLSEAGKDYFKSLVTEPVTEVLQEISTMLGYNIAISLQENKNVPIKDAQRYTAEDISSAIKQVFMDTLKGTAVIGLGSSALSVGSDFAFNNLGQRISAEKYTSTENANSFTKTNNIESSMKEQKQPKGKVSAIPVVKIGDKYVLDRTATAEQNWVVNNASNVYLNVKNMYADITRPSITYKNGMSVETINSVIRTAYENNEAIRFSYTDSQGNIVSDYKKASNVVIETGFSEENIIIPISEKNTVSRSEFESDLFGMNFSKVSEDEQTSQDMTTEEKIEKSSSETTEEKQTENYIKNEEKLETNDDITEIQENEIEEYDPEEELKQMGISIEKTNNILNELDKEDIQASEPETIVENIEQEITKEEKYSESATQYQRNEQEWIEARDYVIPEAERDSAERIRYVVKDMYKNTAYSDNTDIIADATVLSMSAFAKAQGKTLEQFMSGLKLNNAKSKDELGFYERSKKILTLTEKAQPTTMVHEISHHFLNTLQDGEIKEEIKRVYKTQLKRDNPGIDEGSWKFGDNSQEAFAKDAEKYIFLRKASNSKLRNLFESLYNLCKSIWKISDKSRLTEEKKQLFDMLFGSKPIEPVVPTVINDGSQNANEKIAKTVDKKGEDIDVESKTDEIVSQAESTADKVVDLVPDDIIDSSPDDVIEVTKPVSLENIIPQDTDSIYIYDMNPSEIVGIGRDTNIKFDGRKKSSLMKELDDNYLQKKIYGLKTDSEYKVDEQYFLEPIKSSVFYEGIAQLAKIDSYGPEDMIAFRTDEGSIYARITNTIASTEKDGQIVNIKKPLDSPKWIYIPIDSIEDITSDLSMPTVRNSYEMFFSDEFDSVAIIDEEGYASIESKFNGLAIADAFISALNYTQNNGSEILYSKAQEGSNSDTYVFANAILNTLSTKEISNLASQMAKNKDVSYDEILLKSEKIKSMLEGFSEEARNTILDRISDVIHFAMDSYSVVAKNLSKALKDNAKDSDVIKAYDLLLSYYSKARENMSNKSSFAESERKYFKDNNDLYTKWISTTKERGKGTMTVSEIKDFISLLVNKEGGIKNVEQMNNGYIRSYLIDILNLASSDITTNNPFATNMDYIETAQGLLQNNIRFDSMINSQVDISELVASVQCIGAQDGFLADIYNSSQSESMIDSVLKKFNERIMQLGDNNELLEKYRTKHKELSEAVRKYEAEKKRLERKYEVAKTALENQKLDSKEALKKAKEDYAKELEEFKKSINLDLLEEENKKLKKEVVQNQIKIKSMLNNKAYLTAKELKEKYNSLFDKMRNAPSSYDARAAAMMKAFVDELRTKNKKDKKIGMYIFNPKWEGYDMSEFLQFAESSLGLYEDNGSYYIKKSLSDLDLKELGNLSDIVNRFFEDANENMKTRKEEHEAKIQKDINMLVRSIWKNAGLNEKDFNIAYEKFIEENRPGSASHQSRFKKKIPYGDIETMYNMALRISKEYATYLYGGMIDGKYISNNLNSAMEKELSKTHERISGFYNQIGELFGFDPKKASRKINEIFSSENIRIGTESMQEFTNNTGISFGTVNKKGNRYERVTDSTVPGKYIEFVQYILNDEVDRMRQESQIKKKINALRKKLLAGEITQEQFDMNSETLKSLVSRETLEKRYAGNESNSLYNMQQMMGVYINLRQSDGIRSMIADPEKKYMNNNLSVGNLLWVIDQFETNPKFEPYRKLADYMVDDMASRYDETADVVYRTENRILPRISNYFMLRHYIFGEDVQGFDVDLTRNFFDGSEVTAKETKERNNSKKAISLDVVDNYMKAISEHEHFISHKELMSDLNKIMSPDSKFSKSFEAVRMDSGRNDGEYFLEKMREALKNVASSSYANTDTSVKILNTIRNNLAVSVLWGNISASLQQFPTYMAVTKYIGVNDSVKYLIEFVSNIKENTKFVYSMSKQMEERRRLELFTYKQANKGEKVAIAKSVDSLLGEGSSARTKQYYDMMIDAGLSVIDMSDAIIANASWYAIYKSNLNTMEQGYLSFKEFQEMCANDATQKVLNINPSQYAKDNALLYSSKDTGVKSMLLFTAQLNKMFNMVWGPAMDFKEHMTKEKAVEMFRNLMIVGVITAATAGVSGKFIPDSEDDEENIILNAILATLAESAGLIPMVGSTIRDVVNGDAYSDAGPVGTFVNLFKVIGKDKYDRTENQLTRAWMKSLQEIATLVGFPSNVPYKIYNSIVRENPGYIINSDYANIFE